MFVVGDALSFLLQDCCGGIHAVSVIEIYIIGERITFVGLFVPDLRVQLRSRYDSQIPPPLGQSRHRTADIDSRETPFDPLVCCWRRHLDAEHGPSGEISPGQQGISHPAQNIFTSSTLCS